MECEWGRERACPHQFVFFVFFCKNPKFIYLRYQKNRRWFRSPPNGTRYTISSTIFLFYFQFYTKPTKTHFNLNFFSTHVLASFSDFCYELCNWSVVGWPPVSKAHRIPSLANNSKLQTDELISKTRTKRTESRNIPARKETRFRL